MAACIETNLLVLHGVAVKKAGSADAVVAVLGIGKEDVEAALNVARDAGRVIEVRGAYMVTAAGQAWLEEQYPVAFAEIRSNRDFVGAYDRFEVINKEILDLFTRWQTVTRGGQTVPNDHTDEDYDNKVIDELGDTHERALPVLDLSAAVDPRFSVYKDRLSAAYDRVLAGDKDWISGARIDSYHTIWFELDEDILRLLGRKRRET